MNKERNRCTVRFLGLAGFTLILFIALTGQVARAVPVLQVGASLTDPFVPLVSNFVSYTTIGSDEDTAFVFTGNFVMVLGGRYGTNVTSLDGGNYDSLIDLSTCATPCLGIRGGPVIVVSVPEGTLGSGSVTINSVSPFLTRTTLFDTLQPGGRVIPPHYPTADNTADFMFFDLATVLGVSVFAFAQTADGVRDFFQTPGPYDKGKGQEVGVNVATSVFTWVHFDLIAIETTQNEVGPPWNRRIVTTYDIENNPFSHDVTVTVIPEPGTLLLLGSGLMGAAGFARRRFFKGQSRS